MGLPSVTKVTSCLAENGVAADLGNPGGVMPHLTRPLVAVNMLEATENSRTFAAYICVPMTLGRVTCENYAVWVASCWSKEGGQCRWGNYRFDSKAAMHIVQVTGVWKS